MRWNVYRKKSKRQDVTKSKQFRRSQTSPSSYLPWRWALPGLPCGRQKIVPLMLIVHVLYFSQIFTFSQNGRHSFFRCCWVFYPGIVMDDPGWWPIWKLLGKLSLSSENIAICDKNVYKRIYNWQLHIFYSDLRNHETLIFFWSGIQIVPWPHSKDWLGKYLRTCMFILNASGLFYVQKPNVKASQQP